MDGKIEYSTENYISTTESVSRVSVVSVSSSGNEILYSPSLEIKVGSNVLVSSKNENSRLTSTPSHIPGSNHGECDVGSSNVKGCLRERKDDRPRVNCMSEGSNVSFYEGTKQNKRRRMTLLQSLSSDEIDDDEVFIDTLENHLFPDMSFSESDLSYSDSKFNASKKTNLNWSKLRGVSYLSKFDFSGDELDIDCSINHPNRSIFRQKRRDWYLNRRNAKISCSTSLWWRLARQFLQIISIVSIQIRKVSRKISRYVYLTYWGISERTYKVVRYVSRPVVSIFCLVLYIYTLIQTNIISMYSKVLNVFKSSSDQESIITESIIADNPIATNAISGENTIVEKEKIKFSCSYFVCWIFLLFAILLAIFAGYYEERKSSIAEIPSPVKSGIGNAYPMYIDADGTNVPIWHIYPNLPISSEMHPMKTSLTQMSPVILYLRYEGAADTPQLKSVYQTLSSLGYHIVVPTNLLSQYEVLNTWKWIKTKTNATAYMWGHGITAATLISNAKHFCKDSVPPNGVIIAMEIKNGSLHQSMEIWSCNCALTQSGTTSSTDFKYNHLKCPISFSSNDSNDVYSQVVACIETVNKDVK